LHTDLTLNFDESWHLRQAWVVMSRTSKKEEQTFPEKYNEFRERVETSE